MVNTPKSQAPTNNDLQPMGRRPGSGHFERRYDVNFQLLEANPAYRNERGQLDNEDESILAGLADTDKVRIRRLLSSISPQHDMVCYEHAVTDRSGDQRWQYWTDRALFNKAAEIVEYHSFGRDITGQRQTELQRKQHAQRQTAFSEEQAHNEEFWARKYLLDRLLREVAVGANQAGTCEDVYRIALSRICAHIGWPLGHVFQRDEHNDRLAATRVWFIQDEQRYAAFKRATELVGYASEYGLPGRVALTKRPLWVSNLDTDPSFKRAKTAQECQICSALALPVIVEGKVVAVLEFFSDQASEPDPLLMHTLADIGSQVSRVVERTRAEEVVQAQVRQQKMIAMLGQDALSGLKQNELFLRASLTIRGTLDVELCDVLELQEDKKSFLLIEGVGWQDGQTGTITLSAEPDAMPGYVLTTGFPVISDNFDAEKRFRIPDFYYRNDIVSSMCVPIVSGKGTYGTLGVHSRVPRNFTREQMAFLQAVASILAQAIERRRAEDALFESRERFATLAANIPGFVFRLVMDADGNGSFAYVSPGAREIFAQDPAAIMGDVAPLIEAIHPEDRGSYYRSVADSARTMRQWRWGGRVNIGGKMKWLQGMARPVYGPNGSILWDGVILDDSARKQAENKTLELLSENRRLTKRLISVQEEDYKRLARELHDELGQSLTAIKADAVLIEKYGGINEKIRISADAIAKAAEHIYDITHSMMERLRPGTLDDLGLVDTLRTMVANWRQRAKIECTLKLDSTVDDLDEEYSMTVYRVIQESLTNVMKHSRATYAEVSVHTRRAEVGPGYLVVAVKDNGVGMDLKNLSTKGHFGLLGIRERVEVIGGHLELTATKGRGFQLQARIPLMS